MVGKIEMADAIAGKFSTVATVPKKQNGLLHDLAIDLTHPHIQEHVVPNIRQLSLQSLQGSEQSTAAILLIKFVRALRS